MDLPEIKGQYGQLYGQPLKSDVEKETSGDYRDTLIKIIDKVGEEKPSPKKKKEHDDPINENDEDAVKLHKAMKGPGTKEDVIIEVVTRNSNSQRQTVKKRFTEIYDKNLVETFNNELSGDFREVIQSLMMPPVDLDAYTLNKAMKGPGTNEKALIGVICSKSAAEMNDIKNVYKKEYKKDLESALRSETNGELRDFLVDLVSGKKEKDTKVDQKKAEEDAKKLRG
ncbi:unnamed protein product, partial [Candidula unifasciata]